MRDARLVGGRRPVWHLVRARGRDTRARGRRARQRRAVGRLLRERGIPSDTFVQRADPASGTAFALDWAEAGDLVILLALTQRDEVLQLVKDAGG